MAEEIQLDGIGVAPGVLETIALVATQGVEGVAGIPNVTGGLAGLVQKGVSRGVCVDATDPAGLVVSIHISVNYGTPLRAVATEVQKAVTDALLTQTGQAVASVDVFVDHVIFPER